MGAGAYLEPLVVVTLLFGGAWINRARDNTFPSKPIRWQTRTTDAGEDFNAENALLTPSKRSLSPSLLPAQESRWRDREISLFGYRRTVETPNTAVFRNRLLSRLLQKFPFLVEAWYWALIYWVRRTHKQVGMFILTYVGISAGSSIYGGNDIGRHGTRC
jgi:hypothetical protein